MRLRGSIPLMEARARLLPASELEHLARLFQGWLITEFKAAASMPQGSTSR